MNEMITIKLKKSSIMNVPLQSYINDFAFLVNGQEFKTSRLVADLLSPTICRIHSSDPTFDKMIINTQQKGDFSHFLNLLNFENATFPNSDEKFIFEIFEILGQGSIEMREQHTVQQITTSNIFSLIKKHEQFSKFYSKNFNGEIEFISSHFDELFETQFENLKNLNESTLYKITKHRDLKLQSEDQLLKFVNKMYEIDDKYKILYENILFVNVSSEIIQEFIQIFDYNELNANIWSSLSNRLISKIKHKNINSIDKDRYKSILFEYKEGDEFNGIIKFLTKEEGGNIHDKNVIEVTSSHSEGNSYQPKNLLDFNNDNYFSNGTNNVNEWICFDFKNKVIKLSNYSIKSSTKHKENYGQIKSWIIEVSQDKKNWTKIDEHKNYSGLNSIGATKTFEVNQKLFARYIRISTDDYWNNSASYLKINSVEFFGEIHNNY